MIRTLLHCICMGLLAWVVVEGPAQTPGSDRTDEVNSSAETPQTREAAPVVQSDAERVSRLTRTIEENEKRLAALKAELDNPGSEYTEAETEFKRLDADFAAKKKELQKLKDAGQTNEADALQAQLDALTHRRQLAKDRFDLAIQERKVLQEQVTTLEQRLVQDREALDTLSAPPGATSQSTPPVAEVEPEKPGAGEEAPPGDKPVASPDVAPGDASAKAPAGPGQSPEAVPTPPSEELAQAQDEAQAKAAQASEAEKQARSVSGRIAALEKNIELERKLLGMTRQKAENAHDTERMLSEKARQRLDEGASQMELRLIWARAAEARERYRLAQKEVEDKIDRVDDLQAELRQLQAEQIATLQQAETKRQEAEQARKKVEQLESPLAPRNVLRWAVEHGPRVIGIIAGMFVLLWLAHRGENHIVRLLAGRSDRGSPEDRENRARTLVGVFRSAASVAVIAGGSLMVLTELGVNIIPLMGGAAVIGLAVAFGAQNLIRDYFYGFMILLESQYTVNDVVKIGDVSGQVERITLRVTVLRGLDGTVHFVPNGEITRVSNMTHGWSRALFEIPVAYKEDVDHVMEVLMDLAKELRGDADYRSLILDAPEMLGVDELGDSAVTIKFFLKTRPLKQWIVKRELLRRIKKKFDELGIEIPFPHRTIFHRREGGSPLDFGPSPDDASKK